MPNKAKYLTPHDVDKIISLRRSEKPSDIAKKKYQIGLARLYKIWTDASKDKKNSLGGSPALLLVNI